MTTDVKKITKDTTDLVFHIKTDKVSPAGNHDSLFCQVVVTQNGEPIVHNIGTGTLRIDVPLPPKPNAPAPRRPRSPPPPKPAARRPPAKPLSRLEKLRLETKQAKAAGQVRNVQHQAMCTCHRRTGRIIGHRRSHHDSKD